MLLRPLKVLAIPSQSWPFDASLRTTVPHNRRSTLRLQTALHELHDTKWPTVSLIQGGAHDNSMLILPPGPGRGQKCSVLLVCEPMAKSNLPIVTVQPFLLFANVFQVMEVASLIRPVRQNPKLDE